MSTRPIELETISVAVPPAALVAYSAAIGSVCAALGQFHDEASGIWVVEGVKPRGAAEAPLTAALALAALVSGTEAPLRRRPVPADGWLARTRRAFPDQMIGRRLLVRGSHSTAAVQAGRIAITLDAGVAFGSGEHGSTRGCLRALERSAHRRPRRILDLGTGSGILALFAARLLHRTVLGVDIDPWSVRNARENAGRNRLTPRTRFALASGWHAPVLRRGRPYDLVFANILARPLCRMAHGLGRAVAPGATIILAGLLDSQANWVLAAHRRAGLRLEARLREGPWTTLMLRR